METISKFECMKYTENVKQWISDDKSLDATIRSMYYVVMGQYSKLMKNKLSMTKDYVRFEEEGDVTARFKKIRRACLQIETNTLMYDDWRRLKPCTIHTDKNSTRATRNTYKIIRALWRQSNI